MQSLSRLFHWQELWLPLCYARYQIWSLQATIFCFDFNNKFFTYFRKFKYTLKVLIFYLRRSHFEVLKNLGFFKDTKMFPTCQMPPLFISPDAP